MAFFTILLVLLGSIAGGVSYEANAALPGDYLYPFKVTVNEGVERFVANTDEARARLDLMTLNERLDEAQVLAKHGRLDVKAQADVNASITEQVQRLTSTVEKFQRAGAVDAAAQVASNLHETLSTQSQKVADTSSLGSTNLQVSLAPILVKLRTTLATVTFITTKAQAKVTIDTAPLALATINKSVTTPQPPVEAPATSKSGANQYFR